MSETKAPAFQVYPADFLADMNVMVMNTEEVGAYWLLILVCWREESLPDDLEELAVIARMPADRFEQSWVKRIRRCFVKTTGDRWAHPRLEKERAKQSVNREIKRQAALKRHHPEGKESKPATAMQMQGDSNADAEHQECLSSSSSLSVASSSAPDGAEKSAKRARARPRQPLTCDDEYLDSLQKNPAYSALDVRMVYSKMVAYCELKGKEPTRGRLLNWLNREDRPMNGANGNGNGKYQANRREASQPSKSSASETALAGQELRQPNRRFGRGPDEA